MGQFIQAPLPSQINPQTAAQPMSRGSGGFIVRNDFSAAGMAPQIDRRAFVQAAASRGAIGEGLQNLGQQIDRVEAIRAHAYNQRKVAEVDSAWQLKQADIAAALAKENDTSKWQSIAQQHVEDFQKSVLTDDLSPDARDAIQQRTLYYGSHAVGQAKISAANREIQLLGQQYTANYIKALNNGDFAAARDAANAGGKAMVFGEDALAAKLADVDRAEKKAALDSAGNKLQIAYMNGDESAVKSIMDDARKIPGVRKDEFDLMEQTATRNAQAQKEAQTAKQQAERYGSLVLTMAQNPQAIVPAMIDRMAADKELSPMQAANVRRAAVENIGAAPGDFGDFISQKVLTYDPTQDPNGAKRASILREGFGMGLDRFQSAQLSDTLEAAARRNATGGGRAESYALKYGIEHIDEMHKNGDLGQYRTEKTATYKAMFDRALGDAEKLRKLGFTGQIDGGGKVVSDAIAEEAKAGHYDRARELFWQYAPTRSVGDDFKKLTGFEQKFFTDAISTYGKTVKGTDAALEDQSAAKAAELKDKYSAAVGQFIIKNKRTPSADESRAMLGDLTHAFQDRAKWGQFLQPVKQAATPDKVSIRGFVDMSTKDLADKLPPRLSAHAQDFIDAGREYGLDPAALAAISWHETGGGKSSAFTDKMNAMGTSDESGPKTFSDVRSNIMHQASVLASSTGPYAGAQSLDEIGSIYAPIGASNDKRGLNRDWKQGVTDFYNKLRR